MTTTYLAEGARPHRAYLLHGDDPGLVSQALSSLVAALEALDGDGAIPLEEYGEIGREAREGEGFALGPVLDACRTPPFLAERRIVVVRDISALDTEQVKEVAAYLAEPLDTTILVLVSPAKRAPAALVKAVDVAGMVVDPSPARGRARSTWFAERLHSAPVRPNSEAAELLEAHLGEDLSRLEGLLATLESAYGTHANLGAEEVAPFLGSAGAVAPWDLTDAIDGGEVEAALAALGRLLGAGMRSPFQILSSLHRHYQAMLRLDGSGITDQQAAAQATGMNPFPAKKALESSRRLGHERIARAIILVADADFALRGDSGWPDAVVLEVLVARLARLTDRRTVRRPSARYQRRR